MELTHWMVCFILFTYCFLSIRKSVIRHRRLAWWIRAVGFLHWHRGTDFKSCRIPSRSMLQAWSTAWSVIPAWSSDWVCMIPIVRTYCSYIDLTICIYMCTYLKTFRYSDQWCPTLFLKIYFFIGFISKKKKTHFF